MRDVADRVVAALEAEAAGHLAGGAHAVVIQRQVCDLGATRDGRDAGRGEHQSGCGLGRDDFSAESERGEARRAVLPDHGLPVGNEPAERHLEEQVRHHRGDGVIDSRPEFRQLVAKPDAAQRRTDRGRCEAVEELALVDREGPVHQIGDAAVGAAQRRRELRAERHEVPAGGREAASVGGPEGARIAAGAVAEHEVLTGHCTMKWSSVRFVVHRRNISMSRSSADSSLCMR